MKYVLQFGPEIMFIQMEGDFTYHDSIVFRRMLHAITRGEHRDTIHINICALKSIDKTALHLLMMAHDAAKQVHRVLVFYQPKGQVLGALNEAAQFNVLNIAA